MAATKILSESQQSYYRTEIQRLVSEFKEGQQYYTHHFEHCGISTFSNDRPLLRKVLRTLELQGKIKNINLGFNVHKWELA